MTTYPDLRFRKKPDCEKIDWFEIIHDCEVTVSSKYVTVTAKETFVINAGYTTDFASVPRWLWSIFPPHGLMANASVVHDYMYDHRKYEEQLGAEQARLFADRTFLKNCLEGWVPTWQAMLMYSIIRLFGKSWWTN